MADLNTFINIGANTANFVGDITAVNLGNVSALDLNGNASTVLAGDGTWVAQSGGGSSNSISNGNSNVSIATADGPVTMYDGGVLIATLSPTTVAIGQDAGAISQGQNTIAIGQGAGGNTQTQRAIAIGQGAGNSAQGLAAVAVGRNAGQLTQGSSAIAVGQTAGNNGQGSNATAIGPSAGSTSQGQFSTAVGAGAGQTSQGNNAVALGRAAGSSGQGAQSVAIGWGAGQLNQGANAIAIGYNAVSGANAQAQGSIALNATGVSYDALNAGFYVAPVRNDTGNVTNALYYNTSTNELTYASGSYGNSNVVTLLSSYGSNTISTTGNVSGGNINTSGNVNAASAFVNAAAVITSGRIEVGTSLSAIGNITGANIATSGALSVTGNATVNGTGSNLTRRSFTIAGSNTKVTLDNITAQVGGTPTRLYIGAATSNLTVAGDSQTMISGSMAVSSWINVPISTGVGNEFAMSGAISTNGDTVVLNIIDQGAGTGMWRITGMIANTVANLYGVTIERLA